MDNAALKQALAAIAGAATDALAAMDEPDAGPVAVIETPDYHAQDMERIEANTDAAVAVIEAQAAADVAVITAAAELTPDPPEPAPVVELDGSVGDAVETLDDALDDLTPGDDEPISDDDLTPDGAVSEAVDTLDALPVLDPAEVADDVAPAPTHWYRRKLGAKS